MPKSAHLYIVDLTALLILLFLQLVENSAQGDVIRGGGTATSVFMMF